MNVFQEALQEKPSQMIRYALQALEEAEKVPSYRIDMDLYHDIEDGLCFMCLGGAAAIKRANRMGDIIDNRDQLVKTDLEYTNCQEYEYTLDAIRKGNVDTMFYYLGKRNPLGLKGLPITPYEIDPAQFKADLLKLADDLEAADY